MCVTFPRCSVFTTTNTPHSGSGQTVNLQIKANDSRVWQFNKTLAGTIAQKSVVARFNLNGICFTLYTLSICVIAPEKSLQKKKKKQEKENHSEDEIKIIYFGHKDSYKDSRMERFMSGARLFWAARHLGGIFRLFFFCRETRTGRQKKQSFLELSRWLLQTPPPRKRKHRTVQGEPPTHPRYAWLCSSCIHLGCLRSSVQYVNAAFPPSTLSLTLGHSDGGARGGPPVVVFN